MNALFLREYCTGIQNKLLNVSICVNNKKFRNSNKTAANGIGFFKFDGFLRIKLSRSEMCF